MNTKPKALAIGAGAIGKSISGYIFSKAGFELVYADVVDAVIDDINQRGGYVLRTACIDDSLFEEKITGVRAVKSGSQEALLFAAEADVIVTAVGPFGLRASLPTLCSWLRARTNDKPLHILLFENDVECKHVVEEGIIAEFGELPSYLTVSKTSIERMTKPYSSAEGCFDCLSEDFIPVIASNKELEGTLLDNEFFMLVDDPMAYYYRKLYTNNLGHALLGYVGSYFGYEDTTSAMQDQRIYSLLMDLLHATGSMLCHEFGFTPEAMEAHIATLEKRYRNENLRDNLARLARDPFRKIGPEERILGAARLCLKHNIPTEAVMTVLGYALLYKDPQDNGANEVQNLLSGGGIEEVLTKICQLSPEDALYREALTIFSKLTD